MKKGLQSILLLLVGIFIGYWMHDHQLWTESWPVQQMAKVSHYLDPAIFQSGSDVQGTDGSFQEENSILSAKNMEGRTVILEDGSRATVPAADSIDYALIEELILDQVNNLRAELGLQKVYYNETLAQAADVRAEESARSFSHTRSDGRGPFTVLTDEFYYPYYMVGENLGMATLLNDESYMAHWLMEGWINSPEHYETLVNPNFNELGVGVVYSDQAIYAAQIFGVQA